MEQVKTEGPWNPSWDQLLRLGDLRPCYTVRKERMRFGEPKSQTVKIRNRLRGEAVLNKTLRNVRVVAVVASLCFLVSVPVTGVYAESAQSVLQDMESRYETIPVAPSPSGTDPDSFAPPPAVSPASPASPPEKKGVPTVPKALPWRVSNACDKTETSMTVDTNVRARLFFNGQFLAMTPTVVCIRRKAIWTNDGAFLVRLSRKGYSDIVDTVIMGTDPVTKHYLFQK